MNFHYKKYEGVKIKDLISKSILLYKFLELLNIKIFNAKIIRQTEQTVILKKPGHLLGNIYN